MSTAIHTFTVSGMHCASCGLLIDDTLEDLPGVVSSHTSRKTGIATVELDPNIITPDAIAAAIRSAGYHVP